MFRSLVSGLGQGMQTWLSGSRAVGFMTQTSDTSIGRGQYLGTSTNDNATAGNIGEYVESSGVQTATPTATITIASPAVVSVTDHQLIGVTAVYFTTTGALPTGITAGTTYYTLAGTVAGSPFMIATTTTNALAGTAVNTSGSQSGVHTSVPGFLTSTTNVAVDVGAISLLPGDWNIFLGADLTLGAGTTMAFTDISIGVASVTRTAFPSIRMYRYPPFASAAGGNISGVAGPYRASISTITSYFGVLRPNFTVSSLTPSASTMIARRAR